MRTTHVRAADVQERWFVFDASTQPLGRMASQIATLLMGKDQPTYTPSELSGAHVVVIHADKVVVTGRKSEQKDYAFYSGYPGGLKEVDFETLRERDPARIVRLAVRRMLPKTRLGKQMLGHLRVYSGAEHPHTAQNPVPYEAPARRA
ncbi:MAG: 50S ribosomal protein L13 [Planctomycetota bacterium]|jgi:large subunit ribosomal protein L13